MILTKTFHVPGLAAEVTLDHWRGVLERMLERHTVIDWFTKMSHPACAMVLQQVATEAGLVPYRGSACRFQCGSKTIDWLMARKARHA